MEAVSRWLMKSERPARIHSNINRKVYRQWETKRRRRKQRGLRVARMEEIEGWRQRQRQGRTAEANAR